MLSRVTSAQPAADAAGERGDGLGDLDAPPTVTYTKFKDKSDIRRVSVVAAFDEEH